MRIRVAIIEQDTGYLEKITNVFNTRYTEQVEIHAFTVMNRAIEFLQSNRVDMILVDEQIEMQLKMFPSKCNLAYLVDSMGIESVKGYPAICKFQKVNLIYKQILSIYSENSQSVSESHLNLGGSNVIVFMSPAGGTGTSSMAAACAMQCAGRGNNVLYLNLEKFGSSDAFFSGEGQFTMSDIIFALKGRKANLAMKLQSCVKKATCGVDFFSTSQTALDMLELDTDDIIQLIVDLKNAGTYQYVIMDMDFDLGECFKKLQTMLNGIVMVGDGSAVANRKLYRAVEALEIMEKNLNMPIINRTFIIYNKFRSQGGKVLEHIPVDILGGTPFYMQATTEQVVKELSCTKIFDAFQ